MKLKTKASKRITKLAKSIVDHIFHGRTLSTVLIGDAYKCMVGEIEQLLKKWKV